MGCKVTISPDFKTFEIHCSFFFGGGGGGDSKSSDFIIILVY